MNEALPDLRIDRARLANARPGDRDRLASALAMASPAATGVAERGLLLVRKLRMDRPLGAGVEAFAGELIDRIRAAKVNARRGSLGAGDSAYFESEIALEVAIVQAWLAGARLPEAVRRAILASDTPLLRWRRNILPDARRLVGVVTALIETGDAGRWLAHFDAAELDAATERVVRVYGGHVSPAGVTGQSERAGRAVAGQAKAGLPRAIVEAAATARAVAVPRAAQALVLVAVLAARRPALLASRDLDEMRDALRLATPVAPVRAKAAVAPGVLSSPAGEERRPTPPTPGRSPVDVADMPRKALGTVRAARPTPATTRSPAARGPLRRQPAVEAIRQPASLPSPVAGSAVASAHAGLFFLLNVFLALGLYGDFTDPARGLKGLSPFELLLLLGRRWIGPRLGEDPIAPLLRSLSGLGPRARVGGDFEAPAWRLPPDWLAPWPDLPTREILGASGTSRWHRQGFPVADDWLTPRPAAWMRRRWVACLGCYVEARLMRALGAEDRGAAVRTLTELPGAITVDPEHVEISFLLDAHPLAIRLAGLDRDPGWIPAAGRTIGFRFT